MGEELTDDIVHRKLDTDDEAPVDQLAEVVSELEGRGIGTLQPLYRQIDHVLDQIFSDPPAEGAQVEITFTYEGYRITVEQNGHAQFVKI